MIAFVKELVASGNSGGSLPPPISFYAPNVVYNGKQVGRDFIARQIEFAFTTFPQRSAQLVSGPTIGPPQKSGGCTVNYEVVATVRNSLLAFQVTISGQLNIELHGDQFLVTGLTSRIFGGARYKMLFSPREQLLRGLLAVGKIGKIGLAVR